MYPPEYWRDQAEQARAIAGDMATEQAQEEWLRIAEEYDRLAQLAEREEERELRFAQSWASPTQFRL